MSTHICTLCIQSKLGELSTTVDKNLLSHSQIKQNHCSEFFRHLSTYVLPKMFRFAVFVNNSDTVVWKIFIFDGWSNPQKFIAQKFFHMNN